MHGSRGQLERTGALVDEALLESGLVTIGVFRVGPDDPGFEEAGPITRHLFAFPRTPVVIEHERRPPFIADPSVVTCYNVGQPYRRSLLDPRGDACDWFSIRGEVLRDVIQRHDPSVVTRERPFLSPHTDCDARCYALQRQLFRLASITQDALAVEETALMLADLVAESAFGDQAHPVSSSAAPDDEALARDLKRQIAEEVESSASLDELARRNSTSVSRICRVFRTHVGTTIHQFRLQARLRRSLELIAVPGSDLSRIALQLGFSSHSHFTAAFRKVFRVTPSEFRRSPTVKSIQRLARRLELV